MPGAGDDDGVRRARRPAASGMTSAHSQRTASAFGRVAVAADEERAAAAGERRDGLGEAVDVPEHLHVGAGQEAGEQRALVLGHGQDDVGGGVDGELLRRARARRGRGATSSPASSAARRMRRKCTSTESTAMRVRGDTARRTGTARAASVWNETMAASNPRRRSASRSSPRSAAATSIPSPAKRAAAAS